MQLKIPPPFCAFLMALLMTLPGRSGFGNFDFPGRTVTAALLLAAAILTAVSGLLGLRALRTTSSPFHPERATALATGGVFRFSRNPIYLGLALALAAWGLRLANIPALAVGPGLFVLWIDRMQILPEERALEALFGDAWSRYRTRVRRWI